MVSSFGFQPKNKSSILLLSTMWTIEKIEALGFKLIQNEKLWCHFRGHGFDVLINLNTKVVRGNYFNFKSYSGFLKGNFKAVIDTEEEFKTLLRLIV